MVASDTEYVFEYPWEMVIEAFYLKYKFPNPSLPDMIDVQYTDLKFDPDSQTASLTRRSRVKIAAPAFILKLAGVESLDFETKIEICRPSKIMKAETRNVQFSSVLRMHELITLRPDDATPERTQYRTQASFGIAYIMGISVRLSLCINYL